MGSNHDTFIGANTNRPQKQHISPNPEDVLRFNQEISAWSRSVSSDLKSSISIEIDNDEKLSRTLKDQLYPKVASGDQVEHISIKFKREGVFVHKGVGRGYEMRNGSVVKTAKTNTFARTPKEWFNPVVERHIPELETIIAKYYDSVTVDSLRILIM